MPTADHLKSVIEFLKNERSNEANFARIAARLDEELGAAEKGSAYQQALAGIKEKQLPAYTEARETGGSAWPEFENLVSEWERAVTAEMKG